MTRLSTSTERGRQMQIVIDIPEEDYKWVCDHVNMGYVYLFKMIANGTPLTESDDCVSRAELLKALDTWDKFGVDDTGHLFRLDNLSYPHYEPYIHYRDVIKAVKGMPSVQSKRKKRGMRLIDADETLKRIADKSKKSDNLDVINGLCGATAIIYDMLIESGQESEDKE